MTDQEKQAKKELKKILQEIKGLQRWTIARKSKKR